MDKYYRVKKDTFMWKEGAILRADSDLNAIDPVGGYRAVEDIWDSTPINGAEYISARIIEHPLNADIFERVYPDSITGKLFKTKDQLLDMYSKAFKGA